MLEGGWPKCFIYGRWKFMLHAQFLLFFYFLKKTILIREKHETRKVLRTFPNPKKGTRTDRACLEVDSVGFGLSFGLQTRSSVRHTLVSTEDLRFWRLGGKVLVLGPAHWLGLRGRIHREKNNTKTTKRRHKTHKQTMRKQQKY
jgi:hypothetical protein